MWNGFDYFNIKHAQIGFPPMILKQGKDKLICCAMRGQPNSGLRRFISIMALMTSLDGPLDPGLRPPLGEYSCRYFRLLSAAWNRS
jgi:hypothetical protein